MTTIDESQYTYRSILYRTKHIFK